MAFNTLADAKVLLQLAITPEVYTAYRGQADATTKPIDEVINQQLTRFQHLSISDRPLILTSTERELLEQLLAGPIADPTALLKRVRGAVETSIQGVKLTLEPWQLAELKRRAEKNETSSRAELEKAVKEISALVFNGGAP